MFQTYCLDAQVPDSACTATSYLSGVKTKYGVIGLDGNVTRGSCTSQLHKANWAPSIGQWALDRGFDVGELFVSLEMQDTCVMHYFTIAIKWKVADMKTIITLRTHAERYLYVYQSE